MGAGARSTIEQVVARIGAERGYNAARQRDGIAKMPAPDLPEATTRIGCGVVVGLVAGLIVVVGTGTIFLNSGVAMAAVVVLSIAVCGFLGWRYGDRFFHSLHKWIRWLQ